MGGALGVAQGLGARTEGFVADAKDAFVHALSSGLRLGSLFVLGAAFVAWRFLPARAHDPLVPEVEETEEEMVPLPVGGE